MKITILSALIFALLLDIFAYGTQLGIDKLNETTLIYNYGGSFIGKYGSNNTVNEFTTEMLPGTGAGVDASGGYFSDIFQSIKNWLLDTTGLKFVIGLVTAVPNFISLLGLPAEIAYLLGGLWHALTIFLIVAFLKE